MFCTLTRRIALSPTTATLAQRCELAPLACSDLSKSRIASIEVGAFDDLTLLTTLDLRENRLEKIAFGTFPGLARLHTL